MQTESYAWAEECQRLGHNKITVPRRERPWHLLLLLGWGVGHSTIVRPASTGWLLPFQLLVTHTRAIVGIPATQDAQAYICTPR